jgi:hypothetical protein
MVGNISSNLLLLFSFMFLWFSQGKRKKRKKRERKETTLDMQLRKSQATNSHIKVKNRVSRKTNKFTYAACYRPATETWGPSKNYVIGARFIKRRTNG